MPKINGIPSGNRLRKQLGRVGISNSLKNEDPEINSVIAAVDGIQGLRTTLGVHVIPNLRAIRKACIAWLFTNFQNECPERIHIDRLLEVCEARLRAVIEFNFAKSKVQRAVQETRDSFRPLFDQVILQQGGNGTGKA